MIDIIVEVRKPWFAARSQKCMCTFGIYDTFSRVHDLHFRMMDGSYDEERTEGYGYRWP